MTKQITTNMEAKDVIHYIRSILAEIAFSFPEGKLSKKSVIKLAEFVYNDIVKWESENNNVD